MNETIGAKGGHNDSRRIIKIKEKERKRIIDEAYEREIKELERKVKKQQRYTLIKALPIAILGQTIKTLYDKPKAKEIEKENNLEGKELKLDDNKDNYPEERKIIVVDDTGKKIVTTVSIIDTGIDKPAEDGKDDNIVVFSSPLEKKTKDLKEASRNWKNEEVEVEEKEERKAEEVREEEKATKKANQEFIPLPEANVGIDFQDEHTRDDYSREELREIEDVLSDEARVKLDKLKARKIIDVYEKQLKDIRYDLRQLIFEYNVLCDLGNDAIISKETEVILDKLSEIIRKVDELKRKIRIEDLDKYDDNYIYTLVEGYLEEFKDKKLVSEIKDSPLYVLISEKLDELDVKKEDLGKKVENKKEKLEKKEEDFDKLKEKYFNIDKINKDLMSFQNEQDILLREMREKIRNATTIQEKVEVQVEAMNRQSRKLLRMLTMSMFFPGARAGRSMATAAATYLYFLNNVLKPKTTTRKYKVITVKDYSRDIEKSLEAIDDASKLLGKTSRQIEKMINEVETEFKDYLGVMSDADELLNNLRKIKEEVREKEYEMERIKKEQELVLEKNNAKVKTMGEYPM